MQQPILNRHSGTGSSPLMHTSLGKSMAVFLLVTALAVTGTNAWSLWFSWQQKLAERENDAHNLSVSLAKQAEDAFLQVDITLADAVRQLRQNGINYALAPAFTRQLREQHGKLPQLHGLFIYDVKGNWVATSGNYVPASPAMLTGITLSGTVPTVVRRCMSAALSAAVLRVIWSSRYRCG